MRKSTPEQLVRDTAAVIAAARGLPEVEAGQIYLYGWSQGAQWAAHAAAADAELAGLILQGAPASELADILRYQHLTLGLPLLHEADKDGDGKLSVREWFDVPAGPATLMGSFYVWSADSTPLSPKLRPELDRDGDKLVDLEGELRPAIEALLQNPAALAGSDLKPGIGELLPGLGRPVLLLHGEADGWVPATDGDLLAAAAPEWSSLRIFPGLGHALSSTADPAQDSFGVMEEDAIQAVIEWLRAHSPLDE